MNTKLFNVKINIRKIVITFLLAVLLGKYSKDLLTTLILLELGILAYKDLTSRDTKYELSGIFSILLIFHKKSLVFRIEHGDCLAIGWG